MSQHDYNLANQSGASYRSDNNNALDAIVTWNSGTSAPATTFAKMRWVDTTAGVIKRRNAANSGWIVESTDDETRVSSRSSNTMLDVSDIGKTIRATSTFTQTFDAVATLGDGWVVHYINEGSGVITLDPNSSETIDGASTLLLYPGESALIACNGSNLKTLYVYSSRLPQNSQSAAYTTVLADAGKHILHPTADNNPRTFTIDSNANVAYPIGTTLTFVNEINTLTIAITSDTLVLAGSGSTGSRTLGAMGTATALKKTSTSWIISGVGLT
jgi:hypothetical protein